MVDQLASLCEVIAARAQAVGADQRFVVALAGPPAAGKSTIAEQLSALLAPRAAVLGLDAFHYDDAVLEERGHRERKGAPHTFDVAGYRNLLSVLRSQPRAGVAIPMFDRSLELSRNCAAIVSAKQKIIVTEGNYLLLDSEPWSGLADLFDLTVWVDTPLDVVEQRILSRWRDFDFDPAQAAEKAAVNDLPNARLVIEQSRAADITIDGTG